ncbi:hypothetical protein HETIRDRAFT_381588 [Heterobasidion irregulare TC 32-1]|uniref:MutL C-terminal dimerisation domain-containing protein n=1 Tax=Heterobasidion irregulare (strain TC 32-1) TaxID=747525 RepID=W4KGJ5_HETIT|nr:uncharacterized protein HETIRDRAFT_381588 [Heterobasidion irregulare TC 32-1]ETW84186.1 hypothetical protein HETIRDRAFT_381588 [Heterobasidion irregulare TC 32-1]
MNHLLEPVRTKLRSSQILTSLPQVISELVQNSLDARANQIEVGVDCEEWECWVKDNGAGISKDGLLTLSKRLEAGRYNTSKAYAPNDHVMDRNFGFRGEALASAADISCVEISTRTPTSKESWTVILKSEQCLYDGPSVRWRRETAGTTVCLRDIFYNLPIRRSTHSSSSKTLSIIRKDIELLALVFPEVCFSLDDIHSARQGRLGEGRIATIPKTSSTLSSFRHIFGKALATHVDEIDVTAGEISIRGFISLDGALSKTHQYLYVNRHPLTPCHLHRKIDDEFANSSFAKHAFDESGKTSLPLSAARRTLRKWDKKPVYVLDLTIPRGDVDNLLEPAKATMQFRNGDIVINFVASVIQSYLVRNAFMSQNSFGVVSTSPAPGPAKRRRVNFPTSLETENTPSTTSWARKHHSVHGKPITDSLSGNTVDQINWTDQITGVTYNIDPRTGNSYVRGKSSDGAGNPERPGSYNRRMLVDTRWLKGKDQGSRIGDKDTPRWVLNALQINDTFTPTEPHIPVVSPNLPPTLNTEGNTFVSLARQSKDLEESQSKRSRFFDSCLQPRIIRRFRRDDLLRTKVIGQLDKKFIVCTIDTPRNSAMSGTSNQTEADISLILVDQHAASERVRVERLLKELCLGFLGTDATGVRCVELAPPKPVLLTKTEAQMLQATPSIRETLRRWGFSFADAPQHEVEEAVYQQVWVKCVPEVVSEKLMTSDEMQRLLKGYLASCEADGVASEPIEGDCEENVDEFLWHKALRSCPRELLDLVNSRACRGAVMFNDSLTLEQCERLIEQLAETVYPFQCAHGRPSLTPLSTTSTRSETVRRGARTDWESFPHGP